MNHMKKYKFIILYIINGFLKTFKSHTVRRQSFQMSCPIVERPKKYGDKDFVTKSNPTFEFWRNGVLQPKSAIPYHHSKYEISTIGFLVNKLFKNLGTNSVGKYLRSQNLHAALDQI